MGQNIINIALGLLGFIVAVLVVIYAKIFIAKLFNINVVDRQGRHLYDAESFDNINQSIKEQIINITTPTKKMESLQYSEELQTVSNTVAFPGLSP